MTNSLVIGIVLTICSVAFGATPLMDPPLMGGLPWRDAAVLDGDWSIIPDPYDQGRIDFLSRPMKNGFWMDQKPADETQRVEYAFDEEHTLRVPGDWNTQDERFFFYEKPVWYKRGFEFTPDPNRPRTFLRFGAVANTADVWLNGQKLGSHEVGFTPFEFEVTELLKQGENTLVVRVDNTRRPDQVPAMVTDWWNYGGITRGVLLISVPETFVRDTHAELNAEGNVVGWVFVDGPNAGGARVDVRIGETTLAVTTTRRGLARFGMDAGGLERWSPEHPVTHPIEVACPGDVFVDRVGLRTISTEGPSILLNGEPIFLRGICIHEEALGHPGRAHGEEDARELLGLAKELGCNYVRLAHYPHDEWMTRVADELGLMVWAEIPVYWEMEYENPRTLELARTHLREMMARDHNRASVIIWSVGNETGDDPAKTEFRLELGRYVKKADPTRLLSAALFARMPRDNGKLTKMIVDDPFGELADVLAVNEYVGWYHDTPEDVLGMAVELAWDKPFVISETGAGVKRRREGSDQAIWSEAFGERFYRAQLGWCDQLRDPEADNYLPNFSGVSPWILKDFLSPRRALYGVQDWFNRKGLVDETGAKKRVFGVVQERYADWAGEDR